MSETKPEIDIQFCRFSNFDKPFSSINGFFTEFKKLLEKYGINYISPEGNYECKCEIDINGILQVRGIYLRGNYEDGNANEHIKNVKL